MGWGVGQDPGGSGRFVGYGVPAVCEDPLCIVEIDRGVESACGNMHGDGCGRYFCGEHLVWGRNNDGVETWICARCKAGQPPYPLKPDSDEWVQHVRTDPSWAEWRQTHQPDEGLILAPQPA